MGTPDSLEKGQCPLGDSDRGRKIAEVCVSEARVKEGAALAGPVADLAGERQVSLLVLDGAAVLPQGVVGGAEVT